MVFSGEGARVTLGVIPSLVMMKISFVDNMLMISYPDYIELMFI